MFSGAPDDDAGVVDRDQHGSGQSGGSRGQDPVLHEMQQLSSNRFRDG